MKHVFHIKVYSALEAIVAFALVLAGCTLVLFKTMSFLHIKDWNQEVLKAILLFMVVCVFWIVGYWASTRLCITVDTMGVHFQFERSILGIKRAEDLITWMEMKEWSFAEGHLSAHSWSPDVFKIKSLNGKTKTLYLASLSGNAEAFQAFLTRFTFEAQRFNLQNSYGSTIEQSKPFEKSKTAMLSVAIIGLALSALSIWYFVFHEPLPANFADLIAMILLLLSMLALSTWLWYRAMKNG